MTFFAQDFHYTALKVNNPTGGIELGIFDPTACYDSLLVESQYSFFTDITFDSLGELYIFSPISNNPSTENSIRRIVFFQDSYYTFGAQVIPDEITALACIPTGETYAAGKGLWDTNGFGTGTLNIHLGDFPPSMQAAGDMTYRDGKLYLSSISNTLIEVDINNPANSTVAFDFPLGTPEIHGLATVEIECDSFITYASGITGTGSIIYEVDFDNETLIEICQSDRFIVGLASMDECFVPQCDITIDLDANDNSGALINDFEIGKVCTLPINIVDEDVSLYSELDHIDSIQINLMNINYANEYIELSSANNIIINGNGTTSLTLINNGAANILDFENAMFDILYNNDALTFLSTPVNIEVVAYSYDVESEPAYSTIFLGNSDLIIGISIDSISCFGGNDGEITVITDGGVGPYFFQWNNNSLDTNLILGLSEGTYQITITDKFGCSAVENNIMLTHPDFLEVQINNTGALAICNNGGQLLAAGNGGVDSYQYIWSNGVTTAFNNGINSGTYTVTLTDQNGCEAFDSIIIGESIPVFSNESISLCQGDTFTIDNQEYSSDTIICEVLTLANGCDSTHCYELEFIEIITTDFSENICPGESFIWNGEVLSNDTVVSNIYTSVNGCDSIVTFNLELFNLTPISFVTSGNLCDGGQVEISTNAYNTYLWSTGETTPIIEVGEEDVFGVTVSDNNSCEIVSEIEIGIDNLNINYVVTPPSCYGDKDAIIQIDNIEGGTEPYLFALDGQSMQQSSSFGNLESGTYNLFVEDINGCQKEMELIIDEPLEPILEIQNYHELDLGDSLELQLITNITDPSINWEPGIYLNCDTCLNVISNPLQSLFYEITASDINGCITKNTIEINVDRTLDVFIPNAFSPNDDGFNDLFSIYSGTSGSNINYLKIFDRWGELVYLQKNFLPNSDNEGWDGRFKNKKMLDGVYIYVVEVERVDGSVHSLSGELTLVR